MFVSIKSGWLDRLTNSKQTQRDFLKSFWLSDIDLHSFQQKFQWNAPAVCIVALTQFLQWCKARVNYRFTLSPFNVSDFWLAGFVKFNSPFFLSGKFNKDYKPNHEINVAISPRWKSAKEPSAAEKQFIQRRSLKVCSISIFTEFSLH